MKTNRTLSMLMASMLVGMSMSTASADARLLNMNSPKAEAGKFKVIFKNDQALREIPQKGANAPAVLPEVLPVSKEDIERLSHALAARVKGTVKRTISGRIRGFTIEGVSKEQIIEVLAKDPRIDYIEPSVKVKIHGTQGSVLNPAPWHLNRIDEHDLPMNVTYEYDVTAPGVTVWVIDSGIRFSHTEFENRVLSVRDCVNNLGGGCHQFVYANNVGNPNEADCDGHGTAVASLIGGKTYGVAKQVKLVGMIVFNSSYGHPYNSGNCDDEPEEFDVVNAIDEVDGTWGTSGPTVINLSIGTDGISTPIEDVISDLIEDGKVVVASAGNDNENACNETPGRMPAVITVGASTQTDERWWSTTFSGSNTGNCVDLFAPGHLIDTADRDSNTDVEPGQSGTSLSAAIVSGIAALYLQTHATATPADVHAAIVNGATVGALSTSAGTGGIGGGSPNRLAYSRLQLGNDPPDPSPPSGFEKIISAIFQLLD